MGAGFALALGGVGFGMHFHDWVEIALGGGVAALFGWFGFRGANAAVRFVMVRRATPFEVFIAGATGAIVAVWFHSGAGSGSSSSSSSSSKSDERSSGGGSFGGGGASGSW